MARKKPKIDIISFLMCKNKLAKEYGIEASRKFNIGDETYVIKKDCSYPRIKNNNVEMISVYAEGNPNPFDLTKAKENKGLASKELDSYIAGDIFNIIMECRRKDKTRYIVGFCAMTFILGLITFISWIITGV